MPRYKKYYLQRPGETAGSAISEMKFVDLLLYDSLPMPESNQEVLTDEGLVWWTEYLND